MHGCLEIMEFLFSFWIRYLTSERSERVRYPLDTQREISNLRAPKYYSLFNLAFLYPLYPEQYTNKIAPVVAKFRLFPYECTTVSHSSKRRNTNHSTMCLEHHVFFPAKMSTNKKSIEMASAKQTFVTKFLLQLETFSWFFYTLRQTFQSLSIL